jgi:hypothetical protein
MLDYSLLKRSENPNFNRVGFRTVVDAYFVLSDS